MKRLLNRRKNWISLGAACVATVMLLLTGCASGPRIQADRIPAGSLRLSQVMVLIAQKEIIENKELCQIIFASGISETEIKDGSFGIGRVHCCGGPNEKPNATCFYVPAGIRLKLGDIVEVRIGHPPRKGEPGKLNTVTQVRQQAGDEQGSIRWDPPNERLWRRILYADWMPKEGWVYQGGLWNTWYKPPPREKQ